MYVPAHHTLCSPAYILICGRSESGGLSWVGWHGGGLAAAHLVAPSRGLGRLCHAVAPSAPPRLREAQCLELQRVLVPSPARDGGPPPRWGGKRTTPTAELAPKSSRAPAVLGTVSSSYCAQYTTTTCRLTYMYNCTCTCLAVVVVPHLATPVLAARLPFLAVASWNNARLFRGACVNRAKPSAPKPRAASVPDARRQCLLASASSRTCSRP